jgi:hypothetical protein
MTLSNLLAIAEFYDIYQRSIKGWRNIGFGAFVHKSNLGSCRVLPALGIANQPASQFDPNASLMSCTQTWCITK